MSKPKLLLHTCCAPCSGFLASQLLVDFAVTIYFDNSNIYPKEEYLIRRSEAKKFFTGEEINFVEADYNHEAWLKLVQGLENEPERGVRCEICYRQRLYNTAQYAVKHGFEYFGTTLSISPHKDVMMINRIGQDLSKQVGVNFLEKDFKKQDGFKHAMEFSHSHDFYHQNYCGCEFSFKNK